MSSLLKNLFGFGRKQSHYENTWDEIEIVMKGEEWNNISDELTKLWEQVHELSQRMYYTCKTDNEIREISDLLLERDTRIEELLKIRENMINDPISRLEAVSRCIENLKEVEV